jgi:hypothetical protein
VVASATSPVPWSFVGVAQPINIAGTQQTNANAIVNCRREFFSIAIPIFRLLLESWVT